MALARQLEQARLSAEGAARREREELSACTFRPATTPAAAAASPATQLRALLGGATPGAAAAAPPPPPESRASASLTAAASAASPAAAGQGGPKGYSAYLRRMARAADEREEKKRIEGVLAAGLWHRLKPVAQRQQQLTAPLPDVEQRLGTDEQEQLLQRELQLAASPDDRRSSSTGDGAGSSWAPAPPRPPLPFGTATPPPSFPSSSFASSAPPASAVTRRTPPPPQIDEISHVLEATDGATAHPPDDSFRAAQLPTLVPPPIPQLPPYRGHHRLSQQEPHTQQQTQQLQASQRSDWMGSPGLIVASPAPLANPAPAHTAGSSSEVDATPAPPLLYLDVNVTPELVSRIPLWAHSDLHALAAAFAAEHSLGPKLAARLVRLMQQKRAEALSLQAT
jgi:hypothetical protein